MKNVFSQDIEDILLHKISLSKINEIRLRVDKPILVCVGTVSYFICSNGLTTELNQAIYATKEMIENIVFRASECSIYAVNEQIKKGFIGLKGGIRLGLCGTVVQENGNIKTIKDFQSINIRVPHQIKNCSLTAFDQMVDSGRVFNTLVISPPGAGKTTFLRDFVWQLSNRNFCFQVLILDERGEIAGLESGFDIGKYCDVLSFADKKNGFEQGIRSMNPDIIISDELANEEDYEAVLMASRCGVKVIASIHANNLKDLRSKPKFHTILNEKCFERFVVLSKNNGIGTYEGIFNDNYERVSRLG